jgi:Ca-activated chloride channel family protein
MYTRILLGTAATLSLMFMAGCVPDSATDVVIPQSDGPLNLATFYAWPDGNSDAVDLDSVGRNNLVFVVDRSGSMSYDSCSGATHTGGGTVSRSDETKVALTSFIPTLPNDLAVGYVEFGTNAQITVPLGTNNRQQLMIAAEDHSGSWGGTNLTDAVKFADNMLSDQALLQNSTGTYRIVIITDGVANDTRALANKIGEINTTPIEVMTAGFCIGARHILNQIGETVYVEANDTVALTALLTAAVEDESTDFVVDFTTINP